MESIKFTKVCELIKDGEVIHIFENKFYEKLRLVTKNKEDYVKNQEYEMTIRKL